MPGAGACDQDKSFKISSDGAFKNRSDDIFSSLNSIEFHAPTGDQSSHRSEQPSSRSRGTLRNRHEEDRQDNREERSRSRPSTTHRDPRDEDHRSRPHSFRRPNNRPRRSYIPDFRRNPQNYTAYDLSGVENTTDRGNTSAALGFLQDLRDRREKERSDFEKAHSSDYDDKDSSKKVWGTSSSYVRRKHVFNQEKKEKCIKEKIDVASTSSASRPSHSEEVASIATAQSEKPKFIGGKLTMPEYVIGQSSKSKTSRINLKSSTSLPCDALALGHLEEIDEEKEEHRNIEQQSKESNEEKKVTDVISENKSEISNQTEKIQFKKFKKRSCSTRQRTDDD